MTTKDLIPNSNEPDEKVWLVSELIAELQRLQALHGDLPVVNRGYEMGMDNLHELEVLPVFRGGEGCCGTYSESNYNDPDREVGVLVISLGNAG